MGCVGIEHQIKKKWGGAGKFCELILTSLVLCCIYDLYLPSIFLFYSIELGWTKWHRSKRADKTKSSSCLWGSKRGPSSDAANYTLQGAGLGRLFAPPPIDQETKIHIDQDIPSTCVDLLVKIAKFDWSFTLSEATCKYGERERKSKLPPSLV